MQTHSRSSSWQQQLKVHVSGKIFNSSNEDKYTNYAIVSLHLKINDAEADCGTC